MTDAVQRLLAEFDSVVFLRRYGLAALAFIPALTLSALWFGMQGLLLVGALTLPGILVAGGSLARSPAPQPPRVRTGGLSDRAALDTALDRALALNDGFRTAALIIAIDGAGALRRQYGDTAMDAVMRDFAARIDAVLREGDVLARHGEDALAIALAPGRHLDLEAMVQLSARLQQSLSDVIAVGEHGLHLTASVGFCLPRRPEDRTAKSCMTAAETALAEAQSYGPAAIRAFTPKTTAAADAAGPVAGDLPAAFEAGQVVPWFQPQISTDTGAVTGMEALARWEHPDRGVIPPGDFLPAVAALGLERQLSDTILAGAFDALARWDAAGHEIGSIGVNFSSFDLADPMLSERIRWELDRHEVDPARLTVEVLETVIADGNDDTVARSIQRLAALGCRIDLDDFGTGHAAIGNIRRFSVGRIKIDRSFISRIDTDPDQQTLVTAILEMAQRLGLETLAEGVETVGEHALLAQLGCGHVQGFSIARPMPFADTLSWLDRHRAKTQSAVWPARRAG